MKGFIGFDKLHGFTGKSRKGRKSAKKASEYKEPEFIAYVYTVEIAPAESDENWTKKINQ